MLAPPTNLLEILGLLFGLLVLKRVLRLRDTTVLLLSTLSMGLDSLLIGLASSSLWIYLSMLAGFLHALMNPLLFTLYSCLVDQDEVCLRCWSILLTIA